MSRWQRFSAIVQDGRRRVQVVRVVAADAVAARAAALRKAQKEAMSPPSDGAERKVMTRDKFVVHSVYRGHLRDAG